MPTISGFLRNLKASIRQAYNNKPGALLPTHVVVLLEDNPVSCALYASSIVYAAFGVGARIIVSLSQFA